jgi:hypothetical protein
MSPPIRRRPSSPVNVAITLILIGVALVLGIAGLDREAVGEPIVPQAISQLFSKSDPGLPPGLNYDLSVLDPTSQRTLSVLPELGTIEIRLAITNDTALPMTLHFPTSLQCEFVIRRIYSFIGGLFVVPLEVWRSSYFHNYAKTPTKLVLQPGETKVYTSYWTVNGLNQLEVPPGDYRVFTSFVGIKPLFLEKPL